MCKYQGEQRFQSLVGNSNGVNVRLRVVDTTYMRVTVLSMRPPPYKVAPVVQCVALDALPNFGKRFDRYTIVGAGKAAMDACLWLLWHGIKSADLTWIRPGDEWLHNRANPQPGLRLADRMMAGIRLQNQAVAEATSVDDVFERLVWPAADCSA